MINNSLSHDEVSSILYMILHQILLQLYVICKQFVYFLWTINQMIDV
jgi:hypothetical protein